MSSNTSSENLSQFEWTIMNAVWKVGKGSAREILDTLASKDQRAYTTIQTYLERLVDKGYLLKEKIGLVNFYQPIIPYDHAVQQETSRFVDQVFQGSQTRLAAYLFGQDNLDESDLEKIRRMLEDQNE